MTYKFCNKFISNLSNVTLIVRGEGSGTVEAELPISGKSEQVAKIVCKWYDWIQLHQIFFHILHFILLY